MANLGTLDAMEAFNKQLAYNIANKGTEAEKLAYLVGGGLGTYFGGKRRKKDNAKLDDIVNNAQQAPVNYTGDVIGANALTPEQTQSYNTQIADIANMTNAPTGENTISAGVGNVTPNATDDAIRNIAVQPSYGDFVQAPTNNGMNNYNWKYIEDEARRQGISNRVLEARKDGIQKDIAQRARDVLLPQIQKDLYGTTVTDKDGKQVFQPATTETMLNGMQRLNELAKYDPETARAYSTLGVNNMTADRNATNAMNLEKIRGLNALTRDENRFKNNMKLKQYYVENGYNPNGANPRQAKSNMPKVSLGDFDKATSAMQEMIETYGKEKIMKDPDLFSRYSTYATVANNYTIQQSGGQQYPPAQPSQPNQPANPQRPQAPTQPQQPTKTDLATNIRKIADNINYSDWNSVRDSGLEMVKQMTNAGVPENQAMEAVGQRFYSKVKEGKLTKAEYREFMGNHKTKEEINDEAIEKTKRTLHPEQYGDDPLDGLKHFFTPRFDDSAGQKIKENYYAKLKNQ